MAVPEGINLGFDLVLSLLITESIRVGNFIVGQVTSRCEIDLVIADVGELIKECKN